MFDAAIIKQQTDKFAILNGFTKENLALSESQQKALKRLQSAFQNQVLGCMTGYVFEIIEKLTEKKMIRFQEWMAVPFALICDQNSRPYLIIQDGCGYYGLTNQLRTTVHPLFSQSKIRPATHEEIETFLLDMKEKRDALIAEFNRYNPS